VRLCDRDDEPEIGLDHLPLRRPVPALDPLRQVDLLVGRQQRHLPDLAQVEPQGVERGLDGQVELRRRLRLVLDERWLLVRWLLVLLPLDQVDRPFDQVGVEVLGLLPAQAEVLEPGCDLVVGQKPLLKALRDEPRQCLNVGTTLFRPKLSAQKPVPVVGVRSPAP
jgi:hypothetical protein